LANSKKINTLISGFDRDNIEANLHYHWVNNSSDFKKNPTTTSRTIEKSGGSKEKNNQTGDSDATSKETLDKVKERLLEKEKEMDLIRKRRKSAKW